MPALEVQTVAVLMAEMEQQRRDAVGAEAVLVEVRLEPERPHAGKVQIHWQVSVPYVEQRSRALSTAEKRWVFLDFGSPSASRSTTHEKKTGS